LGDALEELGVKIFQDTGFPIIGQQHEIEWAEPPIRGRVDGIIFWKRKWWVFDFKSAASHAFSEWMKAAGINESKAKRDGWAAFHPKDIKDKSYRPVRHAHSNYYWQLQAYLHFMNVGEEYRLYDHKVQQEGGFFFTWNKNDSTIYEEFVPYDREEVEKRLLTLAKGYDIVKKVDYSSVLPHEVKEGIRKFKEFKVQEGKNGRYLPWQCKSCPFVKTSWEEETELLKEIN
jgi:hypothetical protein